MDSVLSFLNEDDVKQIPVDILIKIESHLMAAINNNSYEKDKKILEMRQELKAAIEKFMNLQLEYYEYRKESTSKFSKLSQTKERKIGELQSINSQLELEKTLAESQEKLAKEQAQSLQEVDIVNHLKQIQILEDVNQMYGEIIDKYEIDNKTLREEALDAKFQVTTALNRIKSVENECSSMREEIERLRMENQALETRNKAEKIKQPTKQLDEQQSGLDEEIESLKQQNEREFEERKASERELMKARKMITENNKELETLRAECHMLRENALVVHSKHNNEMQARKDELNKYTIMHYLKLAKDEAMDESMESRVLEQAAIIRESEENRQECERKLERVLMVLKTLRESLSCDSEALNVSTPNINETMTSNRSSQLSPARSQENGSAVFF